MNFTIVLDDLHNDSYANSLNQTLDFEDGYEVCVQDVIIPINGIPQVSAPHNWCNVCEYLDFRPTIIEKFVQVHITERLYKSNVELLREIAKQINKVIKPGEQGMTGFMAHETNGNTYRLHMEGKYIFLIFSLALNFLLGLTTQANDQSIVRVYDDFIFEKSIDLTRILHTNLWLHGDFVKPQMAGKNYYNIITMLTLTNRGVMEQHAQAQLYYVPVIRKRFSALNVFLCKDMEGTRLEVYLPFTITLQFQPQQIPPEIHDGFPMIVTISKDKANVTLNSALDFREQKYVVNLHDMWLSGRWSIVPEGCNYGHISGGPEGSVKFTLDLDHVTNENQFLVEFSNVLYRHVKYTMRTEYNEDVLQVYWSGPYRNYKIDFSDELAYVFGLSDRLGSETKFLYVDQKYDVDKINISRLTTTGISIHADFIKETIVGSQAEYVLRQIALREGVNDYSMSTDNFVNVQPKIISQLGFQVKDLQGRNVAYTSKLTLGLYFRIQ